VHAKVALIPESPVDALLSMGAEHDARMIVVGTYGEHPIRGAILGSTSYKLVPLSDRPVLVVPAD
jgi:nucleotide-binding universal stress UspA family protein